MSERTLKVVYAIPYVKYAIAYICKLNIENI